jgi:hypothetical protein
VVCGVQEDQEEERACLAMGDGDIPFQGWHEGGKYHSAREIEKKNKGKEKKRR